MPVVAATQGFINALRYGATLMQARLTLWTQGVSTGQVFYASLSTGSITVSRNSTQRRSGQITIEVIPTVPPPDLMPTYPSSIFAPFGNEVFLEIGIASSVATPGVAQVTTWVPLGLFAIVQSAVDDTTIDCTVTLSVSDRSFTIAERAFQNPYNFPAGSGNFVDELTLLINSVWSQQQGVAPLTYNVVPTDATVPTASYNQGSSPWQAALDIAAAVGYEIYFDAFGVLVGRPIPNPFAQAPSWYFLDDQTIISSNPGTGSTSLGGSPYSTPAEVQNNMTRQGIYNNINIQGTGTNNSPTYTGPNGTATGSPILASAADNNPASPTYVGGGLGNIPEFVSSSLVTPVGAQEMANNDLQASLSSAWTCTLQIPPNPIFDIDDVVSITRPRVGFNNAYVVIDTITHGIRYADLTSITGRVLSNNNPNPPTA